ncbi:hypothetical protein VA7868_03594 [Vibrio aerogenes CECT 7868]|uniref:DUF4145 domain-containing protein n=1 Tax=Vibrio aerogenes CECT 7868 TaxID=1216006 RepID=A0A1M6AKG3_9VIBR|nr:DUF4145 domain-containing protein [Vibrio aerogenes]SHI36703.1 hypothetical protein VA7868_03594 [Vibrio aerogenes CECT 7868]
MSEVDKVVQGTHQLEELLRVQYHAQGDSLEQLVESSVERLPHDAVVRLKRINGMRKKLADVNQYTHEDCLHFMDDYHACMKELVPRSNRFIWRAAFVLMSLITLFAMIFYYVHWDTLSVHLLK